MAGASVSVTVPLRSRCQCTSRNRRSCHPRLWRDPYPSHTPEPTTPPSSLKSRCITMTSRICSGLHGCSGAGLAYSQMLSYSQMLLRSLVCEFLRSFVCEFLRSFVCDVIHRLVCDVIHPSGGRMSGIAGRGVACQCGGRRIRWPFCSWRDDRGDKHHYAGVRSEPCSHAQRERAMQLARPP